MASIRGVHVPFALLQRSYPPASLLVRSYATQVRKMPIRRKKASEESQITRGSSNAEFPTERVTAAIHARMLPSPKVQNGYQQLLGGIRDSYKGGSMHLDKLKDLVQSCGLEPSALAKFAQILTPETGASDRSRYRQIASDLIHGGSRLKDETATMLFVQTAIRQKATDHQVLQEPLQHTRQLADEGNVAAMLYMVQIYHSQGDVQGAIDTAERASREPSRDSKKPQEPGSVPMPDQVDAFLLLMQLKESLGDSSGAKVALERGIEHHKSPELYYEYASKYLEKTDPKYTEYLLKAAMSDMKDATVKVAQWVYTHAETAEPMSEKERMMSYRDALEYFRVVVAYNDDKLSTKRETAILYMISCAAKRGEVAEVCDELLAALKGDNTAGHIIGDLKRIRGLSGNPEELNQAIITINDNLKRIIKD